jgi:hypothetical protein
MWDDLQEYDVIDLLLWYFLTWLIKNKMIAFEKQKLCLQAGWSGDELSDHRVFSGFDFWVADFRSGGW